MNIRFSPFRKKGADAVQAPSAEPVPLELLVTPVSKPKFQRVATIVNPEPSEAYRLKARLLLDGYRTVETFFSPEALLQAVNAGYKPDEVFLAEFMGTPRERSGFELARHLRLGHAFGGAIYLTSPGKQPSETLTANGINAMADPKYLR